MDWSFPAWKRVLKEQTQEDLAKVLEKLVEEGDSLNPFKDLADYKEQAYAPGVEFIAPVCQKLGKDKAEGCLLPTAFLSYQEKTQSWHGECLGLFSPEAPTSPWEVVEFREGDSPEAFVSELRLMNEKGREIWASVLGYPVWKGVLRSGKRFLWGCSLVAEGLQAEKDLFIVKEGALLERAHAEEKRKNPAFKKEDLPYLALEMGEARGLLQTKNAQSDFLTRVESVQSCSFLGQKGYRLLCSLSAEGEPEWPVDIFAFESILGGYQPEVGDFISGFGTFLAFPVAPAPQEGSWMDSPSVAFSQEQEEARQKALSFLYQPKAALLSVRVVLAALAQAGWFIEEVYMQYYSKMLPSCKIRKEERSYVVFVDTCIEGVCDFPDINDVEARQMQESAHKQGLGLCRFQVTLTPLAQKREYGVGVKMWGDLKESLSFVVSAEELDSGLPRQRLLDAAMEGFKKTVKESNLAFLSPYLAEEVHFVSRSLGTDIRGRATFLRYFSIALLRWQKEGIVPGCQRGTLLWEGQERPCFELTYQGKVTARTIFFEKDGLITQMVNLPGEPA